MTDILNENTLYTDAASKADILKDPKNVATIFWINTLGFMAIYKNFAKSGKFKGYMKGIDKTRIDSIDDTSHDVASALKLANEAKLLTPMFTMEFTKLLYILKTKTNVALDEVALRGIFNKLSFDKIRPDSRIAGEVKEWLEGTKTLDDIVFSLFYVAKYGKTSEDFQTYIKYFYKDFARRAIELSQKTRGLNPTFVPKGKTQVITQTAGPVTPVVVQVIKPKTEDEINRDKLKNFDFNIGFSEMWSAKRSNVRILAELFYVLKTHDKVASYIFSVMKKTKFKDITDESFWSIFRDYVIDGEVWQDATGPTTGVSLKNMNVREPNFWNEVIKFCDVVNYKMSVNRRIQNKIVSNLMSESNAVIDKISKFYDLNLELNNSRYLAYKNMRDGKGIGEYEYANLLDTIKETNIFFNRFKYEALNGIERWKPSADDSYSLLVNAKATLERDEYKDFLRKMLVVYPNIDKTFPNIYSEIVIIDAFDFIKNAVDDRNYDKLRLLFPTFQDALDKNGPELRNKVLDYLVNNAKEKFTRIYFIYFESIAIELYILRYPKRQAELLQKDEPFDFGWFINEIYTNKMSDAEFKNVYALDSSIVTSANRNLIRKYIKFFPFDLSKFNRYGSYPVELYKDIRDNGFSSMLNGTMLPSDLLRAIFYQAISNTIPIITKENLDFLNINYNLISLGSLAESYFTSGEVYQEYLKIFEQILDTPDKITPQTVPQLVNRISYEGLIKLMKIINDRNLVRGDVILNNLNNSEYKSKLVEEGHIKEDDFIDHIGRNYPANMSNYINNPEMYVKIVERLAKNNSRGYWGTYKAYIQEVNAIEFYQTIVNDVAMPEKKKKELVNRVIEVLKFDQKLKKDRKEYLIAQLIGSRAVKDALNDVSQNSAIPLLKQVNESDIKNILKFNNFNVKLPSSAKWSETNRKKLTPYEWIKAHEHVAVDLPALAVSKIDFNDEDLEKMTVEYTKYYNKNHGCTGAEFLESFEVDLPSDELQEFMKTNPTPTVIPAFHATGSIAASMILRFGFKIVTRNVGGFVTTGKMLGDGVYFSNVISKAIQYLGDDGYGRRVGTIGYLLEMDAYIGVDGPNHKSAGIGGDSIRSPEWCVFDPRAQLKIKRAHKVKMINQSRVDELKAKHPEALKENVYFKTPKFKQFLREEKEEQMNNAITFVFYDGEVPFRGQGISFDEYPLKANMHIGYSQHGPEITITGTTETMTVMVPSTYDMVTNDPEGIYTLWKSLTDK